MSDYALGLTKLFLKAGCGTFLEELSTMDPTVVVPLLTEKIAESKRKKGAQQLISNYVLMWFRRKQFKEQKKAAMLTQHRLRSIRARREYQKWSVERQVSKHLRLAARLLSPLNSSCSIESVSFALLLLPTVSISITPADYMSIPQILFRRTCRTARIAFTHLFRLHPPHPCSLLAMPHSNPSPPSCPALVF